MKKLLAASYMHLHEIDVLFCQETREKKEDFTNLDMQGFSYWASPSTDGHAGVAIVINTRSITVVSSMALIETRVLLLNCLHGSQRLQLCCVYAPQRTDPTQHDFFDSLAALLIQHKWDSSVLILGGDLNSDGSHLFPQLNLVPSSTLTPRKQWTWRGPRNTRAQIDYIAIPHPFRAHLRRQMLLEGLASDHRMVIADIHRFRPVDIFRPKQKPPDSLAVLAYDPKARRRFALAWNAHPSANDLDELVAKLDVVRKTVAQVKTPARQATWGSQRTMRLLSTISVSRDEADALNELEHTHIEEATRLVEDFARELRRNPWQAWRYVKRTETTTSEVAPAVTPEALLEYFKSVMHVHPVTKERPPPKPPPAPPPLPVHDDPFADLGPPLHPISDSDFSTKELAEALRTMKNHTASGPDNIPIELFRVPELHPELLSILNGLLDEPDLPEHLTRGYLAPIYKRKGSSADPSNYRPVTLLSQCLKVLNKMILVRLRDTLDKYLTPIQAAYRNNRSTLHHILALHQLVHRSVKAKASPLYATFCDFSKCFDSVYRDKLEMVLARYGVPKRLSSFILRSMDQQKLAVKFGSEPPTGFEITPRFGVMQGCTLAPFLFVLVMDVILRTLPNESGVRISHREYVEALAYADDVILLSETSQDAQALLTAFKASAAYFGFTLNPGVDKTACMAFGTATRDPVKLGDVVLPYTTSYKYLGSMVTPEASWRTDFAKRKKQAWYVLSKFKDIWVSATPADTKRRLFQALIVPILTYAAPTYPATKTMQRTLHVTCNALLRRALNTTIRWREPDRHIHTEVLYGFMPTLPATLAYQQVTAWGHYVRHTPDSPVVAVFNSTMRIKQRREHTRLGPVKSLERLAQLPIDELTEAARLSAFQAFPQYRRQYDQLAFHAARSVELDMFQSFILKRRLGGPPPPGECRRICDERMRNISQWSKKAQQRAARKPRRLP
jgi:hypothetical protein